MSNLTLQEIDIEGNENTDLGQSLNNETSFLHKRPQLEQKKSQPLLRNLIQEVWPNVT